MLTVCVIGSVTALGVAAALAGLARLVAPRLGLVDLPDGRRKLHRLPTPLGGGLAVYLAWVGGLTLLAFSPSQWWPTAGGSLPLPLDMILAGAVIVVLGTLDDRFGLRARWKLAGQSLAASILIAGGFVIRNIDLLGWCIPLGPWAVPLTWFWLVGTVNSLNLLDGMDGVATLFGIVMITAVGAMAIVGGQPQIAIRAIVFAGGLLGVLHHNLPPARLFLGDAGSMLIGLVVGALTLEVRCGHPETTLTAAALALWTLPILDSTFSIVRRALSGRSVCEPDRQHLHHCFLARLRDVRRALLWLTLCCLLTATAAFGSFAAGNALIALAGSAATVSLLLATGTFGRTEAALVVSRSQAVVRSALSVVVSWTWGLWRWHGRVTLSGWGRRPKHKRQEHNMGWKIPGHERAESGNGTRKLLHNRAKSSPTSSLPGRWVLGACREADTRADLKKHLGRSPCSAPPKTAERH